MTRRLNYETDDAAFPAEAYTARGYRGVAWRVYGWELEPEAGEDGDGWPLAWDGESLQRTGRAVCVMVGDDRRFTFDPAELAPLDPRAYCAACGQVGCTHDARER